MAVEAVSFWHFVIFDLNPRRDFLIFDGIGVGSFARQRATKSWRLNDRVAVRFCALSQSPLFSQFSMTTSK